MSLFTSSTADSSAIPAGELTPEVRSVLETFAAIITTTPPPASSPQLQGSAAGASPYETCEPVELNINFSFAFDGNNQVVALSGASESAKRSEATPPAKARQVSKKRSSDAPDCGPVPSDQQIAQEIVSAEKQRSAYIDYLTIVRDMLSIEPKMWAKRLALTALGAASVSMSTFAFSEAVALIGEGALVAEAGFSDESVTGILKYFATSVGLWCLYYVAQSRGDKLTARQQYIVDIRSARDIDLLVGNLPEQVREREPAAELIEVVRNNRHSARELVGGVVSVGQQACEMLVTTAGMVLGGVSIAVVPIFLSGFLRYRSAIRISKREVDAEQQAAPIDLVADDGEDALAGIKSVTTLQVNGSYEQVVGDVNRRRGESGLIRLEAVERNENDQLATDLFLETPVAGAGLYFILQWVNGDISGAWCIWLLMSVWSLRDNISEIGTLLSAQMTDFALTSKRLVLQHLAEIWGDNREKVEITRAPRIQFLDVSLKRPGLSRHTLRNVNCDIPAGQMVAVVGGNGNGKSTFISLLVGSILPTSGSVQVGGFNTTEQRITPAYLNQSFSLIPGLTVRENMMALSGNNRGMDPDEALDFLGVREAVFGDKPDGLETVVPGRNQRGPRFSGGQEQLISLARVLLSRSPLIVLDEPTSALSPEQTEIVIDKLRHIPWQPTVVIVTHNPSVAMGCSLVLVIDKSAVAEQGDPNELRTKRGSIFKGWLKSASSNT